RLVRIALQHTKRRVRAVAARGAQWWERPEAAAYWKAYEAAASRLEVTRIFLVRPTEDRAMLDRVLSRQRRAGVKTFVLDAAKVPEDHVRPLVIFDEHLIHRHAKPESGDGTFTKVEFCDRPEELLAAEEAFRVVFDLAEEAEEVGSSQLRRLWARLFRV
ncbi:MAG TPA: hypothetical protein VKV16_03030, partial [Solirubrobacteraceae bacterium]|nr:hypothetical protein [Solirubrobacteraceae bacterium]